MHPYYSPSLAARLAEAAQPSSSSSSATSLSQGWTRTPTATNWRSSPQYRARYASCPLLDHQDQCEQARYDRLLAWEWTSKQETLTPLPTNRRPSHVANKCFSGKTIAFSGDSLSRQSFHSFACLFHADGAQISLAKRDSSGGGGGGGSSSLDAVTVTTLNKTQFTILWTGDALNPYLLAYTGNRPEPTIDFAKLHPSLHDLLSTQQSVSWLVLNTGLWVDASSFRSRVMDFYQAYTKIIESALALLIPKLKDKKTSLIFRTSPVRHFQNGDYATDGSCPDLVPTNTSTTSPSSSSSRYYGGFAETLQNEKLKQIIKNHNKDAQTTTSTTDAMTPVTVLDAAEIAFARADAHRSERDCSHYCLPGVPDFWNEVMLQNIWNTCEAQEPEQEQEDEEELEESKEKSRLD
ncbi:hypothetical protein HDU86_007593 [Geranomyces michiganensis]|nr:hypothetical protein HDU86_007593 [Geranomyces michiganensis]